MAITLLVAPMMGLIPPHAPWIIGAITGGGFLARRRWTEHFTLVGVEGTCPRCGARVKASQGRLRSPHPAVCEACNFEASIQVPPEALAEKAA
jgi:hypothetical protein